MHAPPDARQLRANTVFCLSFQGEEIEWALSPRLLHDVRFEDASCRLGCAALSDCPLGFIVPNFRVRRREGERVERGRGWLKKPLSNIPRAALGIS